MNGHDLEACRAVLREGMASMGVEVTVSTARPLVADDYEVAAYQCPHGTMFYMHPTGEQIAQWVRDGVA